MFSKMGDGMQLTVDVLFGSSTNLALAILITSSIGILFIGSAFISKYLDKKKGGKK